MEPQITKRTLPCRLTDEDRIRIGADLCKAIQTVTELDFELKAFKDDHKARLLPIERDVHQLSGFIRADAEPREVECAVLRDLKGGMIRVVRTDTQEVVEERVMTEYERQKTIDDHVTEKRGPRGEAEILADVHSILDGRIPPAKPETPKKRGGQ